MNVRRGLAVCVVAAGISAGLGGVAQGQTITATCTVAGQSQACDSGWFTSPVSLVWEATPPPDSTSGCQLGIAYRFDSDTNAPVSCSAKWGTTSDTHSLQLHIELSSPSATATSDRPPDANGWYNHPVSVTLAGSAFSGIASCTPPQAYAGPDTPSTALAGTCTDNAGKTASASLPLRYDATPPSLSAGSTPADGLVGLSWHAAAGPAPLSSVALSRTPGVGRAAGSVLYDGGATTFDDHHVRNGTRYTYTITAADQAGNVAQRTVQATPGIRLLAPVPGARLKAPPTLRWTEIPKASYYNVQLFRGGKILSAWPKRASLRLTRTWRFAGGRRRLAPGRYRWYVWPGFGLRKAARYGRAVGTATFVIR